MRLDEVLAAPGDSLTYLYDYGDGWQHRLVVEESCPAVDDVRLLSGHGARATGGQRRHLGLGRRRRAALRPRRGPGRARRLEREPVGAARAARAAAAPGGSSHEAVLLELLAVAGLDRPIAVDDDVAETATARYRWLLHRVGAGVQLTAAGWLPPALVPEAMSALWPEDRWIGKRNREDLTEPVRRLRASAQRAGLVRISRGKLLPTKAGAALRNDPHRLFVHLAQRLAGRPGDTFARTATALVLVAVAAGRGHHDAVAELLTAAGWVTGGGAAVHPHALVHAAGDALEVLDVAGGWDDADWRNRVVTPAGRALAQAALLSTR